MIKAQFENLLVNNDATNDEYLRHFGFTVEDLSYLISPQSSLSPIKKKQRNVFNFEAFGEETEGGAEGREDSPVALDAALDEFPLDAALDEFPLEGLDQGQGMQGIQGMQEPFAGPDMHLMQLGLQQGLQGLQGQQGQRQLGLGQSAPKVTTSIRSGPRSSAASVSALASCAPTSLSIAPIFAPAPSTSAPTAPVSDSLSPMARGDSAGMFSLCSLTSFDLDEGEVAVGAAKEWDEREGEGAGGVQATMDHFPTTGTVGMDQTAYQMQMQMMQGQMMQGQMQLQMMSQLQNMGNMGNMGNTNMGNMGSMGTDNFGMGTIGNVGNGYPGFNQFYVPPIPGIGYPPDSASVISASTQDSRGSSQSHTSHASHTHSNASHYGSQGSPLYSQGSPMYSGSASEPSSHTHTPIAQGGFVFPHVKQERGMGMGMGVGMGVGMGGGMGIGMSGMGMGMGSIPESGGASGARAFASASAPAPSAPTSAPTSATSAPTSTAPAKDDSSRAAKSLATISRRFVERFGEPSTISYISGQLGVDDLRNGPISTNRVDGAAEVLGVHVRRIYELIKILEILSLVTFTGDERGKFSWKGTRDFLLTLGSIQADAVSRFPEVAREHGLEGAFAPISREDTGYTGSPLTCSPSSTPGHAHSPEHHPDYSSCYPPDPQSPTPPPVQGTVGAPLHAPGSHGPSDSPGGPPDSGAKYSKKRTIRKKGSKSVEGGDEQLMVEGICTSFLQLFLLGLDSISMNHAIQKLVPMGDCQSLNEYNKLNATKIRRVYDVANVLCSLNLISKVHKGGLKDVQGDGELPRVKVEKADGKVLEWSSFPCTTIRNYYLARQV